MARRGGGIPGGGMPGNMNNLMKQAQKMQRQMEESQKELEEKEYEASAGGNAVSVKMNGSRKLLSVKIGEEVVSDIIEEALEDQLEKAGVNFDDLDFDLDLEELEDLIVAAVNEASRQIDEDSSKSMEALTGGLNLGGFPF